MGSSPHAGGFYIDKSANSSAATASSVKHIVASDLVLFMQNLPADITGAELDKFVLQPYDIAAIDFLTARHDKAAVTFTTATEAQRALGDLINVAINGRTIEISFEAVVL